MSILKKVLASAAAAGALGLGFSGSANAADEVVYNLSNPWYLEARIGGPIPRDYDVSGTFTGSYDPDPGIMIAGNIGKYLTSNIRADLGISYVWGHDGAFTLAGGGIVPHSGRVSATTILANAYYEFSDFSPGLTPWVGVGLGATIFNYDNLGGGIFYNDSDAAFTAAFHAGLDFALSESVDLTGRYTLSWTGSHSIATTTGGLAPITIDDQFNNTFTVGVRWKFGG